MSCWLPEHGHDILSRLKFLVSRGTSNLVKGEFAKNYEEAFKRDVKEAVDEMKKKFGADRPFSLSALIDNYTKGIMARKLMAFAAGTNYKLITTETRMLGRPMYNYLQAGDGGYGKRLSMTNLTRVIHELNQSSFLSLSSIGGSASACKLKLLDLSNLWHDGIDDLPKDLAANDPSHPYALGKHLCAPQVKPFISSTT